MRKSIFVILTLFTFISCEKEPDNGLNTKNPHRIKRIIEYIDDVESESYFFEYVDEKLTKCSGRSVLFDFSYENNKVTKIMNFKHHDFTSGNWKLYYTKELILDKNNSISEIREYYPDDNFFHSNQKTIYQYQNNKLVSCQKFEIQGSDVLKEFEKINLVYDNNKLIECLFYEINEMNNWIQSKKGIYTYSGEKIQEVNFYSFDEKVGNWERYLDVTYFYLDDKISSIRHRLFDNETQNWEITTINFIYNDIGYLTDEIENGGERRSVYEYEEGKGNANLLFSEPLTFVILQQPNLNVH